MVPARLFHPHRPGHLPAQHADAATIIAINTGLRIYLFTEQGPDVIFRAGASTFDTFEGPVSQLCGVLADP
jgi:hypothetical protein